MRILAIVAIVPAVATLYFFVFWMWFDYWRRHAAATYAMMFATVGGFATAVVLARDTLLVAPLDLPGIIRAVGWLTILLACGFGGYADHQLGLRVRSFMPFFANERIALRTTGAYGIVRHPIYASGIWFQFGVFLATGYVAVIVACAVLIVGAQWFTRQEERRLLELLEDPEMYEIYRSRVPALFPVWTYPVK